MSLVLFFFIAMSLAGCAAETRYKVLSFFFDGVPKPEAEKEGGVATKKEEVSAAAPSTSVIHGPYAARLCDGCHEKGSNALLLPVQELCYKCHVFKMDKRYIHGPLASGGCIVCHDPHSSGNKFLLVSESEHFCIRCHDEKAIMANQAHKGTDMKCISCHNAHMSDKKYLLK
jgi:predicted CXXCH cytochrome family protein